MKARPITMFEMEISRDEVEIIYSALISKMKGMSLNDKDRSICEQMLTNLASLTTYDTILKHSTWE